MNYDDDKTTEILIPPKPLTGVPLPAVAEELTAPEKAPAANTNNIVHVDFPRARKARDQKTETFYGARAETSALSFNGTPWMREMDLQAPWVIRLLAVVLVVILSILIL